MENQHKCVSEDFEDAFTSNSGGCLRTCDCGRVYFDNYNIWGWDKGELEGYLEKAKTDKNYIEVGHSIGTYIINNKEIVLGCQCQYGLKYEEFILKHAGQIANYLNRIAENMESEAKKIKIKV